MKTMIGALVLDWWLAELVSHVEQSQFVTALESVVPVEQPVRNGAFQIHDTVTAEAGDRKLFVWHTKAS